MLRTGLLLGLILVLEGCATDVKARKLADIDFADGAALTAIRVQLPAQERGLFNEYAILHHLASAHFCGEPLLLRNGRPPSTVGEAIGLTSSRNAAMRSAIAQAPRQKISRQKVQEIRRDLVSEKDTLIVVRSVLLAKYGPAARSSYNWIALEKKIADVEKRLKSTEPGKRYI